MKIRLLTVSLAVLLILGFAISAVSPGRAAVETEEGPPDLPIAEMAAPTPLAAPETVPVPTPEPEPFEVIPTITFSDVKGGTPQADCISYAAEKGLLLGVENGRFDPESLVTRAMAVTVLYRMSGESFSPAETFSDVKQKDWFASAVAWAVKAGVATGYEDGTFRGALTVTRAQLAAFLFRFAAREGAPVDTSVLDGYRDSLKIPGYARDPMAWAVENHLFAGMAYDALYPDLPVTRAQLAQMLTALCACSGEDESAQAITDSLRATVVTLTAEAHDRIQSAVENAAKNYGAIGMQVAVIHSGRVIDSFATGWATKKTDPMTVDHKLRVASVSKVDVALAAMVLWDQGVIDPEESIGTYWGTTMRNPYYKNTPVSIRSILSHTSSIRLFDGASLSNSSVRSTLTGSSGYSQTLPGSINSYGYNNYAFGVLGMTLELAAGKNLNKVMAPIFSMLDIDVSYFSGDIVHSNLHTTIYKHDGSVGRSLSTALGNVHPASPGGNGAFFAGGFTASAKDQARLVALLASDGKLEGVPLVSERAVEFMETSLGYVDGHYQCYPLWRQNDIYGRDTLYYHTGSAFGVYNLLSYDPDTGDGVVVFTSGASAAKDSRGIYAVCGTVSSTVYDLLKDGNSYAPVND